jgi:yecA family protein
VAVRHNAIVETLSTAPETFEPIFARKPNDDIDPESWCHGFYAAMKLSLADWVRLTNLAANHQGPLVPILLNCVDDQGRPLLKPLGTRPTASYKEIPEAVEEMRQYWMPTRFNRRS